MTEKFGWLYDPPTPFASKAEWEGNLKDLRKLAARESHPDAAIAEAEAFLSEAPILSSARGVDEAEGCGSKWSMTQSRPSMTYVLRWSASIKSKALRREASTSNSIWTSANLGRRSFHLSHVPSL